MSTDRETTRIVRSWLEDGVTRLPDTILDAVLDELPTTHQRRATWWPTWRPYDMNRTLGLGAAAAAIVIIAILGVGFLSSNGLNFGGPDESSPSPTEAPSPLALPPSRETLQAGTYATDNSLPFRVTFEVSDGWFSCSPGADEVGACKVLAGDPRVAMAIAFMTVDNVVADPCDSQFPLLEPAVGPSVEDLVAAISRLHGFSATDAVDITLDGFSGREFELTAPSDEGGCPVDGDTGYGTWATPSRTNGVGPGEVNVLQILDVDGVRLVVSAANHPSIATPDEIAEMRRVVDSIHIAP